MPLNSRASDHGSPARKRPLSCPRRMTSACSTDRPLEVGGQVGPRRGSRARAPSFPPSAGRAGRSGDGHGRSRPRSRRWRAGLERSGGRTHRGLELGGELARRVVARSRGRGRPCSRRTSTPTRPRTRPAPPPPSAWPRGTPWPRRPPRRRRAAARAPAPGGAGVVGCGDRGPRPRRRGRSRLGVARPLGSVVAVEAELAAAQLADGEEVALVALVVVRAELHVARRGRRWWRASTGSSPCPP